MSTTKITLGQVPHFKNEWASGRTYKKGAIVSHDGSSFIALTAGPTAEPAFAYDSATGKYTCSEGWGLLAVGAASDLTAKVAKLLQDTGAYAAQRTVALAAATSGKYVNVSGGIATDSGFSISGPVAVKTGKIYLLKSSGAVGANVAVFAQVQTKTVENRIDYTYTYDEDGDILTAKATYGGRTYTYTFAYTDEGENKALSSITDQDGNTVTSLPAAYATTAQDYKPLFFSGASLPDSGYYLYHAIQDAEVIVSAKNADFAGGLIEAQYDIFMTAAYGIADRIEKDGSEQAALTQAVAQIAEAVDALTVSKDRLGKATADSVDSNEYTKDLYPTILYGHGTPNADVAPENLPEGLPWDGVPVFIGQLYVNLDASAGGLYYAIGVSAVSDWKNA